MLWKHPCESAVSWPEFVTFEKGMSYMFGSSEKKEPSSVAKAVREEFDRENKYFDFAKQQIEADRRFYGHLYKYATWFLIFMVGIGGTFQYSSVSQMRSDLKSSLDTARSDMKVSFDAARSEMKASVEVTLSEVRAEIRHRIDREFESEKISKLIFDTARELTATVLSKEIKDETATQVSSAIKAEEETIRTLIAEQTNKLIADLQPTIKDEVIRRADEAIKSATSEIGEKINSLNQVTELSNKVLLARADDRRAFDYLIQIALGNAPEASKPELRKIAEATAAMVITQSQTGLQLARNFKEKQTNESLKAFMKSSNPVEREAAVDSYPLEDKAIIPQLVEIAVEDPSINVAHKAVGKLNAMTGQSFEFWMPQNIREWWEKNKEAYEPKAP